MLFYVLISSLIIIKTDGQKKGANTGREKMARSIYKGECYEQVYKMDNFQIEYDDSKKEQNICAVYCSSSGLYFPNTEEEFCKAFIDRDDKFEWKRQRVERAYKHIWIRDITKEFYVRGINSKINEKSNPPAMLGRIV